MLVNLSLLCYVIIYSCLHNYVYALYVCYHCIVLLYHSTVYILLLCLFYRALLKTNNSVNSTYTDLVMRPFLTGCHHDINKNSIIFVCHWNS